MATALTILNTLALMPMPTVSVSTTTAENSGLRRISRMP